MLMFGTLTINLIFNVSHLSTLNPFIVADMQLLKYLIKFYITNMRELLLNGSQTEDFPF